ncbi:hypothetical protein EG345_08630 [Chryseobacterium carnipullorum]|nr:hypothetical protein EG345_08630 [Chryseobacterium carnipullorum]HBV15219.1 hypothetical protein [Chryseobacterium carnipullorum]
MDGVFTLVKELSIEIHSIITVHMILFLTPVIFYFSVLFCTTPSFKFKISDLKYSNFQVIILLQRFGGFEDQTVFNVIFIGLILFQALSCTDRSYFAIRKHKKRIQQFSANT